MTGPRSGLAGNAEAGTRERITEGLHVKLGRNDPCLCGSGKKRRKCCGDAVSQPGSTLHVRATGTASVPSAAEISRLVALFNAGHYAAAEAQSRLQVKHYPQAGILWKVLALSLQGQRKVSLEILKKAAQLLPGDLAVHSSLGIALGGLGQPASAAASFRRVLEIDPGYAEGHSNLGNALRDLGQLDEAVASYRRALQLNPDLADAYNNLGSALVGLGRRSEAAASYRRALALKPDLAVAHSNLGNVLKDLGRFEEAAACYRRGLDIDPMFAEAHNNLGSTLKDLGNTDAAVACHRRALAINPQFAEAHNNLGSALSDLGQLDEAVASYRQALAINPDLALAHSNLGTALMSLGRMDEGERSLGLGVALSPADARPLAMALSYISYRQNDPRFAELEAIYARRESMPLDDRIALDFAVGKAMELIGRYDRAFAAYDEGNRLYHLGHPFDEATVDRYVDDVRRTFSARQITECAGLAEYLPAAPPEPVPVFIVGMPRSGTSLIEQMLASQPSIFGAGELTKLGELARRAEIRSLDVPTLILLRSLGQEYLDHVRRLAPQARYITDKMPDNYQFLSLIHLMLPNAKIIHSRRDPMDTCFSCYALRFAYGNEYCYDLEVLGRQYLRYRTLMQHWRDVLPAGRILDVCYEGTVSDPERELRRMLEYLELPWNPAGLRFYETERTVRTASVVQVRQPIYVSSIARWRKFTTHLGPLLAILQPAEAYACKGVGD